MMQTNPTSQTPTNLANGLAAVLSLLLIMVCISQSAYADLSSNVLANPNPPTLKWQRVNDMPVGVFQAAACKWKRQVVVTGGINQTGEACDLVQVFNLDTLTWSLPLKLPAGVAYHTQVALSDGRIFLAGGKIGNVLGKTAKIANTWLINIDRNTVTAGPNLPAPADELTSHLLPDGKVIIIGGSRASLYDPDTNQWVAHITLRQSRQSHDSVMLSDGKVVVVGGVMRRTIELVDPISRISRMLGVQFNAPRDDLRAVALADNRVLILMGQNSKTGDTVDENLLLDMSDPKLAKLTPIAPFGIPGGAADMSIATVGPWVVALGGETQKDQQDTELNVARLIDTRTMKVWSLPDMTVAHDDAIAVADGQSVFVIGGYSVNPAHIGPLNVKIPTAVQVVERLILPIDKSNGP